MKIGDTVNLITATNEEHIGTVFKTFPENMLTLTIVRSGGNTQKYNKIQKLPSKTKKQPNIAYWSEITKTKKQFMDKPTKLKTTNAK